MDGADRSRRRPRHGRAYRKAARPIDRHQAAAGLVDADAGGGQGCADVALQITQVALHDRLEIGVEHGSREALVFAELGLHLGRQGNLHMGDRLDEGLADAPLVVRIEKREQQADGARLRSRFLQRRHRPGQGTGVELAYHLAPRRDSLRYFKAQRAGDQGRRVVALQIEHVRAGLAPNLEEVAEPFGSDQRDLSAAPLDEGVGGHRGAVGQTLHGSGLDAVSGAQLG